jgi:hypothetical protein
MRLILSSPTSLLNALTTKSCACERSKRYQPARSDDRLRVLQHAARDLGDPAGERAEIGRVEAQQIGKLEIRLQRISGITSLIDRTWIEGSRVWTVASICSCGRISAGGRARPRPEVLSGDRIGRVGTAPAKPRWLPRTGPGSKLRRDTGHRGERAEHRERGERGDPRPLPAVGARMQPSDDRPAA